MGSLRLRRSVFRALSHFYQVEPRVKIFESVPFYPSQSTHPIRPNERAKPVRTVLRTQTFQLNGKPPRPSVRRSAL
ncbi:MAG: hypothetical protein IPK82_42595 [Polyangiaceae bacterium]|nr:hypothetical protein [Polyangiaceae bacterium]